LKKKSDLKRILIKDFLNNQGITSKKVHPPTFWKQ